MKNEKILTCNEQYVTSASDAFSSDQQLAMEVAAAAAATTLEVYLIFWFGTNTIL